VSRPRDAFDLLVEYRAWARSEKRDRVNDLLRSQNQGTIPSVTNGRVEPYWVSGEFCELVNAATPTFPKNPLSAVEMPAPEGLVLFDGTLDVSDVGPDLDRPSALYWRKGDFDGRPIVAVNALIDYRNLDTATSPPAEIAKAFVGMSMMPDVGAGWFLDEPVERGAKAYKTLAALRCFWALCGQRIASKRRENAPRSSARRALRLDDHVPEIVVVTLRRPAGNRETSDGPGFVEWSHRWIVGGHWRNQYLPSQQRHEPRWIAPYVKGPDDKPLVTDRVYQLVR
jgi:hypothetical protein